MRKTTTTCAAALGAKPVAGGLPARAMRVALAGVLACSMVPALAWAQPTAYDAAATVESASACGVSDEEIAAAAAEAGGKLAGTAVAGKARTASAYSVATLSATSAATSGKTAEGWSWTVNSDGASVTLTAYSGESLTPAVPATVVSLPVTGVVVNANAAAPAITSIDLSAVKGTLGGLKIVGTQLTSLDVSGFALLTKLDVQQNATLSKLTVAGCAVLDTLYCQSCALTKLDVTSCAKLRVLNCAENSIYALDVSQCPALEYLDCHGNCLTSLKVGANLSLTDLYCYNNYITEDLSTLIARYGADANVVLPQLTSEVPAPASALVERLSGTNRYDTMAKIVAASAFADGCDVVILASGENFPDALSASGLAGILGCPVLTTASDALSTSTKETVSALGVSTVYVIGGTSAVSEGVVTELKAAGVAKIERIGGANRAKTSVGVYGAVTGWSDTAIIVKGGSFPDALSIAPYAYASKSPIFLANIDGSISDEVAQAIAEGGFENLLVLGGTGGKKDDMGVQDAAVAALGVESTYRIAGADRYETSDLVAQWASANMPEACVQPVAGATLQWDGMAVAMGQNFPDALASVTLLGPSKSVLMLVSQKTTVADSATKARIDAAAGEHADSITEAYVLGGTAAVPAVVETWLKEALA